MKTFIVLAVALAGIQAQAFTVGQYTGVCNDNGYETEQALYIGEFKNFAGEKNFYQSRHYNSLVAMTYLKNYNT